MPVKEALRKFMPIEQLQIKLDKKPIFYAELYI